MDSSSSIVVGWKVLGFFSAPRFSRLRCCSSGPSLLIGALDHLLHLCHKQSLLSRLNSRSSSSDYRWKQTLENRLRMFLVNRVHLRPSGKPYWPHVCFLLLLKAFLERAKDGFIIFTSSVSFDWFLIMVPHHSSSYHDLSTWYLVLVSSRITWFLTMISQNASTKTLFSHNSHKNLIKYFKLHIFLIWTVYWTI